jgi:hypothetical protein
MQDNDEISVVRRWIAQQRVDIVNEITKLRAKLDTFADMEKMLNKQAPSAIPVVTRQPVWAIGEQAKEDALLALQAAGNAGLTAREYAEVAHLPQGTASARLSILKGKGFATHKQPKYFAIHSTAEDNNIDQGGNSADQSA